MKNIFNHKGFNSRRRRIVRKWLLRLTALGIFLDALGVFGFQIMIFHDPVFAQKITQLLHISGAFGSLCGGCAVVVSETHEFFE